MNKLIKLFIKTLIWIILLPFIITALIAVSIGVTIIWAFSDHSWIKCFHHQTDYVLDELFNRKTKYNGTK